MRSIRDADVPSPLQQEQATGLWKVLGRQPGQQENLINNVAGHLAAAQVDTRRRTYDMFMRVAPELGKAIQEATEKQAAKL